MQDVNFINRTLITLIVTLSFNTPSSWAAIPTSQTLSTRVPQLKAAAQPKTKAPTPAPIKRKITPTPKLPSEIGAFHIADDAPNFDLPITYNHRVKTWITYFQTDGKKWFETWLERSHRYLPTMQAVLKEKGMPQDLAYVAMIESGFSPRAVSSAAAVGYWQFIESTANRYGLQTTWWLDERRDFAKSTVAASRYLSDLYRIFNSWYLSASAYNMGEGRLGRLIKKHKTNNFWVLAKKKDFPKETSDYIPKLLAAMLIAKAPKLYGFSSVEPQLPHSFDYFHVPGGTDLVTLAEAIGSTRKDLETLNPELLKGFVPKFVERHRIRIPKGSTLQVSNYIRQQFVSERM